MNAVLAAGLPSKSAKVWKGLTRRPKPPRNRHLPPEPFPAELWIRIVEECSSRKEWLALCQTCWCFNQIAQACLYDTVHLNDVFLLERSFRKRPELGTYVHDLLLSKFSYKGYRKHSRTLSEHPFLSKLDRFPNLNTLRLNSLCITADLSFALHSHPRLRVVEFKFCTLDNSLTHASTHDTSGSSISEVRIWYYEHSISPPEELWATVIPTNLRSLQLHDTNSGVISSSIAMSRKSLFLEKLVLESFPIPLRFPTSIIQFLVCSPQLRHLSMKCIINKLTDDHRHIYSSLPADAIPLLEYYDGPVELSEPLLRDRPVRIVRLRNTGFTPVAEVLASLQQSSVPVMEFDMWIPNVLTMNMGHWLWDLPTTIRRLSFDCLNYWARDKESSIPWLSALSRLTNLITLCCRPYWAVGFRQEQVMEISGACPSLREIEIIDEKWIMVNPNAWECYHTEMISDL